MIVGDLLNALQAIPTSAEVTFCTDIDNPWDDYWPVGKIIRITELNDLGQDRVCLMFE